MKVLFKKGIKANWQLANLLTHFMIFPLSCLLTEKLSFKVHEIPWKLAQTPLADEDHGVWLKKLQDRY